ncbi:MPN551 family DNA-binding protein [Candidatus Mycoplasma haematohominis]|uniref:MPN551 family DNA-binding protein n=1 Tax=Candidatus Mycoplasma haematohominis TaxID=1494318 RepID=UPI001C0A702A|nr:YqaJ viral recombinase family protein [Candidatus Mycoplasma haemohominis]
MKFNTDKFIFNQDFIFKNNRIHITPSGKSKIKKLKKLTGSRLGAALGNDDFKSPFQLWCDILGMYQDESDRYFLDAGQIIEPKLKDYAEKKIGKKFISYNPREIKFDLFSDNEIFGGIPDGEEIDSQGKVVSILEIKTAQLDKYNWTFKNNQYMLDLTDGKPTVKTNGGGLVKWFKNGEVIIPKNYQDQLSLYLYLRKINKGFFCVAFIKNEDYEDPRKVQFTSEFNSYKNYDVDKEISLPRNEHILIWKEHNINLEEFQKTIDYAKKWYEDHVLKGVSPELDEKDLTWFRYGYPELG